MARVIQVTIDSNEQEPILFPPQMIWTKPCGTREILKLQPVRKRLRIGDYALSRHPRCGVLERKRDMDELRYNLMSPDKTRFMKAWTRFTTGCQYPILLIETPFDCQALRRPSDKIIHEDIRSALYRLQLAVPRLTVIWSGSLHGTTARLRLGAEIVRLLLTCTE